MKSREEGRKESTEVSIIDRGRRGKVQIKVNRKENEWRVEKGVEGRIGGKRRKIVK